MKTCSQPTCERAILAQALCSAHYQRMKRGKPLDTPLQKYAPGEWSEWRINNWGYRVRSRLIEGRSEFQLEHRIVMEEVLGRPLVAGENVHHKNRNKVDNRPENLELWTVAQPSGARHADMLEEYARILRENGYTVEFSGS